MSPHIKTWGDLCPPPFPLIQVDIPDSGMKFTDLIIPAVCRTVRTCVLAIYPLTLHAQLFGNGVCCRPVYSIIEFTVLDVSIYELLDPQIHFAFLCFSIEHNKSVYHRSATYTSH